MPSFDLRHAKRGAERSATGGEGSSRASGPRFMGAGSIALLSLAEPEHASGSGGFGVRWFAGQLLELQECFDGIRRERM